MNINVGGHTAKLNGLQQRTLAKFAACGSCTEVAKEMHLCEATVRIILQTTVETLEAKTLFNAVALHEAELHHPDEKS